MGCPCSKENTLKHTSPDTEELAELTRPRTFDMSRARVLSFHNAIAAGNNTMIAFHAGEHSTLDLINAKHNEESPLHIAVRHKQYHTIRYLLENNASPNALNGEGETSLHIAVRMGDMKAVKQLCEHNADKSITSEHQETPLLIALQYDTKEHLEIMLYLEPDRDALLKQMDVNKQMVKESQMQRLSSVLMDTTNRDWINSLNTVTLEETAADVYDEIEQDLSIREKMLIPLEDWLDRKQQSIPYSWLRRWVVVKEKYLLWSERQITISGDHITAQEKKRWNKCISLNKVISVEKIEGKKNRRFKVKTKKAEHIFRAIDKKKRDHWVKNLNENVALRKSVDFMGSPRSLNSASSKRVFK